MSVFTRISDRGLFILWVDLADQELFTNPYDQWCQDSAPLCWLHMECDPAQVANWLKQHADLIESGVVPNLEKLVHFWRGEFELAPPETFEVWATDDM